MERDASNKVVVVTGGANGIAFEIANHFLKEHAKVVIIVDIDEEQGFKAVEKLNNEHGDGKSVFYKCDITKDLEDVSGKIFKEYNQVDVLVNSAGVIDEYNFKKVIETNLIAVVECSMKFFEHMRTDKDGKGGTIINISSMICFENIPLLVFYKTSKCGVLGFSTALGHETNHKKFGVRVFSICPGATNTTLGGITKMWKEHINIIGSVYKNVFCQEAAVVGLKTLEAFGKAESGSVWKIVGGVLEEHKTVHGVY